MNKQTVVILGLSDNPERYSNKAYHMLKSFGHHSIGVHPTLKNIETEKVYQDLSQINQPVDTITIYINEQHSALLKDKLIALKPKRVIFNPGAENQKLSSELKSAGIGVENACTLVLLSTGQF